MNSSILDNLLNSARHGQLNRVLFPRLANRNFREVLTQNSIMAPILDQIISRAEEVLNEPIPILRLSGALSFQKEGQRTGFEADYFSRRNNLSVLVLAYLLSHNSARYFSLIIDYLGVIMEERFWVLPAHGSYDDNGDPYPLDSTKDTPDIFACSTASQVAEILYVMGGDIEKYSPGLVRHLKNTAIRQVISPLLDQHVRPWWINSNNNWNTWCAQELLTAGIILLDDDERLLDFVGLLWRAVQNFWELYPEDGYCDEGVFYWGAAGAQLILFLERLNNMVPGSMEKVFTLDKFANIAEFPCKMRISGNLFYVFADGVAKINKSALWPYFIAAKFTGRDKMLRHAGSFVDAIMQDFSLKTGYGGSLRDVLQMLDSWPQNFIPQANCMDENSFFPGRLAILRKNGLIATLKGGHNKETHNHNDLGHFSFYVDGAPVIIDIGSSEYTKKYFTAARYEVLSAGAHGHNAPFFCGQGQEEGRDYCAEVVMPDKSTAAVLFDRAYPHAMNVSGERTIQLGDDKLIVRDKFSIPQGGDLTLELYSPSAMITAKGAEVLFDNIAQMRLVNLRVKTLEKQGITDPNIRKSWGDSWWHISLECESKDMEYEIVFERISR